MSATPHGPGRLDPARHTGPGLPPHVERLTSSLILTKVSVGPMDNNAYLLAEGDALVLIDAANDGERLLRLIGPSGPDVVITTHRHDDHLQALSALAVRGARLVAGEPDAAAIATAAGVDVPDGVWDGDWVRVGAVELEVVGLVGHTPGSVTCVLRTPGGAHLFTGDSLFPGGPGRTPDPGAFRSLMDDLEAKIFARFPDDTVVHPGHGNATTLGAERAHLAEWRARGW